MKWAVIISLLLLLAACKNESTNTKNLEAKIDSLEKVLAVTYKPGFGEFMSGIQFHHAKLWFAGINQNWELAEFEIHEIVEALEAIQKFCTDRPEAGSVSMINPAIKTISDAIAQKDTNQFRIQYVFLTTACNDCHKATKHAFNVVTLPSSIPVVNQDFKPSH